MAALTLATGGPTPDPLSASSGEAISITNQLGQNIVLTLSHAGLLNPSNGTSLSVPSAGWSGTVGTTSGDYSYNEPGKTRAPRTGTIESGKKASIGKVYQDQSASAEFSGSRKTASAMPAINTAGRRSSAAESTISVGLTSVSSTAPTTRPSISSR